MESTETFARLIGTRMNFYVQQYNIWSVILFIPISDNLMSLFS
jgi:hypothetical protein